MMDNRDLLLMTIGDDWEDGWWRCFVFVMFLRRTEYSVLRLCSSDRVWGKFKRRGKILFRRKTQQRLDSHGSPVVLSRFQSILLMTFLHSRTLHSCRLVRFSSKDFYD